MPVSRKQIVAGCALGCLTVVVGLVLLLLALGGTRAWLPRPRAADGAKTSGSAPTPKERAEQALQIDAQLLKAHIDNLSDPKSSEEEIAAALEVLAEVGPPAAPAIPHLLRLARHPRGYARGASQSTRAVQVLVTIGEPAFPAIGELLADTRLPYETLTHLLGGLKENVCFALRFTAQQREQLVSMLDVAARAPHDSDIRQQIVSGLATLRPPAMATIIDLMNHPNAAIRADAANFARSFQYDSSLEPRQRGEFLRAQSRLAQLLDDPDRRVRQNAIATLEVLRKPPGPDICVPWSTAPPRGLGPSPFAKQ